MDACFLYSFLLDFLPNLVFVGKSGGLDGGGRHEVPSAFIVIMEGSDIAVPRIISEILKLASSIHWLDESGERRLEKCRWHTAWGEWGNGKIACFFCNYYQF